MTKAITSQRKQLYKLFGYCKETEAVHVLEATNNKHDTAGMLTSLQATNLIKSLCTNWAVFNINNQQHKYIMSLLQQLGWVKAHVKYGQIADMNHLSNFLKSKKSPVPMPLQSMSSQQVSKLISCLESMVTKHYGK